MILSDGAAKRAADPSAGGPLGLYDQLLTFLCRFVLSLKQIDYFSEAANRYALLGSWIRVPWEAIRLPTLRQGLSIADSTFYQRRTRALL